MNIIDRRDKSNVHRKRMKDKYDAVMELSVQTSDWVPLLQEGMVTYGDGTPWFYIMRGAISHFYDNLPADYEGSINIGHTDMATFPERIVGRWTKQNMRVVDIEDGRQRLETDLPLNREHPLVEALEQAEFDMGLSVEMTTEINWDLTDNQELNPFGVPIVEHLFVYDYAIVGNAGDVNSMGVHLKGGSELQMNKLAELLKKEGGDNIEELTSLIDKALSGAEEEKLAEVETAEEAEESAEETEETDEVEETEEIEETEDEAAEEEPEGEDFAAALAAVVAENERLKAENEDLKARLEAKEAQLQAKETAEAEFMKKFKKLSVSLSGNTKPQVKEHKVYTDGIGE